MFWASILAALGDSVIKGLFGLLSAEMAKRGLVEQGQERQAAAEVAKSEAGQAGMAQAITDAPKTKDAALARLEGGTA